MNTLSKPDTLRLFRPPTFRRRVLVFAAPTALRRSRCGSPHLIPITTSNSTRDRVCRPRAPKDSTMRHVFSDISKNEALPDDDSSARLERLLRGANEAAALRHRLALIDIEGAHRLAAYHSHFNPNQPRVPKGHHDGGQWTRVGGGYDPRVLSDVTPHNDWQSGAQYANANRRSFGPIRINGRLVEPTPGQAARLAVAQARAHDAIARVRDLDRNWKPRPSLKYETVEGLIRTYEAEAQEAEAQIAELARVGIGPGPFAGESIPARGPERDFTIQERATIDQFGYSTGCHTCGTRDPSTIWRHFVPDHQPPTRLNSLGRAQRLYPQCVGCSRKQGLWIIHNN